MLKRSISPLIRLLKVQHEVGAEPQVRGFLPIEAEILGNDVAAIRGFHHHVHRFEIRWSLAPLKRS
jgi:hypothetical protein